MRDMFTTLGKGFLTGYRGVIKKRRYWVDSGKGRRSSIAVPNTVILRERSEEGSGRAKHERIAQDLMWCAPRLPNQVQYKPFVAALQQDDRHRWFPLIVFAGLVTVMSGCGLLGKSGPEEARLSIQLDGGQEIQMITSTRFLTSRIQEIAEDGSVVDSLSVLILDADTFSLNSAFDSIYDISIDQRFYVRMIRSAPGGDNLSARVWVDDDLKFTSRPDDPRDSLQFIYNFAGPPGQSREEL